MFEYKHIVKLKTEKVISWNIYLSLLFSLTPYKKRQNCFLFGVYPKESLHRKYLHIEAISEQ